jgi:hypothetical protein
MITKKYSFNKILPDESQFELNGKYICEILSDELVDSYRESFGEMQVWEVKFTNINNYTLFCLKYGYVEN